MQGADSATASRASRPGQAARHAQARVHTHERRERDGGRAAGLGSRQRARQRRLAQQPQHARGRRARAPARPARPHLRLCLRAQAAHVTRDGSPGSRLSIAACSGTAGARRAAVYRRAGLYSAPRSTRLCVVHGQGSAPSLLRWVQPRDLVGGGRRAASRSHARAEGGGARACSRQQSRAAAAGAPSAAWHASSAARQSAMAANASATTGSAAEAAHARAPAASTSPSRPSALATSWGRVRVGHAQRGRSHAGALHGTGADGATASDRAQVIVCRRTALPLNIYTARGLPPRSAARCSSRAPWRKAGAHACACGRQGPPRLCRFCHSRAVPQHQAAAARAGRVCQRGGAVPRGAGAGGETVERVAHVVRNAGLLAALLGLRRT